MGTRAGVPAERDATAGARLPPGRTPDCQGGERLDPQPTRGTPGLTGRRGRVPEEGPRDGGREGQIGARGPATQHLGTAGETRRSGAGIRVEGSHLPRSRDVARCAGRVPRTGAETDERPLHEPTSRGREDLRGPEGVRGPAPGGGTPRTAPHGPRNGHPGPRNEAPRACGLRHEARAGHRGTRKVAPPTGGRARIAGDGARREDLEARQAGRSLRNARCKPRRPARGTRAGDETHGETREGPGGQGSEGLGGGTRSAGATDRRPATTAGSRDPREGARPVEAPARPDGRGALRQSHENEGAGRQVASIRASRPAATPDNRDGRTGLGQTGGGGKAPGGLNRETREVRRGVESRVSVQTRDPTPRSRDRRARRRARGTGGRAPRTGRGPAASH